MFTLTKDNAVRIVGTEKQASALEDLGYIRTSGGSAIATPSMDRGTYSFNLEDMTDPHTPFNRGVGAEGELATSMGSLVKKATVEASQEKLAELMLNFSGNMKASADSFTEIVTVSVLPTSAQSTTKLYMLTKDDAVAGVSKGIYQWKSSAWKAYVFV